MPAPFSVWERMANRCARAQGCTLEEIAGWYGVSRQAIEQRLRQPFPRRAGIRTFDHEAIAADVRARMPSKAIAKKHGCALPTVSNIVSIYHLSGLREDNKNGGRRRRGGRSRQMRASDIGLLEPIDPAVEMKAIAVSARTAAILATFYSGVSHRQIAARLGLSLGIVQRTLKRNGLMGSNSGSGANRSETVEDSANCLGQRDEGALGTSLHRAQHDGDERGQEAGEV